VTAIACLIDLCREFGVHTHIVHLATELALPLLREAKREGLPISVETCPHYLTFAAEDIADGATTLKCAPPIRGAGTREALWRGLVDGDIDLIASDHSPCPPSMKRSGDFVNAWGGIASLELGLPIVWTGAVARRIGIERIVEWMCAAPARLAGLDGRKGAIVPGKDADLVIWNPEEDFVVDAGSLLQRHKQTPYDGRRLRGRVLATYARGRVVYGNGGG
jgi:allantoinase